MEEEGLYVHRTGFRCFENYSEHLASRGALHAACAHLQSQTQHGEAQQAAATLIHPHTPTQQPLQHPELPL